MEEPGLLADGSGFRRFPVWIIEHVWTHRTMDIQQVVDSSDWPDVDSQPLSVEDSWRLRVASAQAFCIVKSRDTGNFERVLKFLEATHRLLPRLVAPIKHMKILFGLKTLIIMWMLRQRRGMIDTMLKICQFFPNKLPQYQDQCNQHEMFLMRKNNLDFKVLAQALVMDKEKLDYYVQDQMEQQYGEHYAQRVEDRLLQYLQELEAALPGDTFIDRILKKDSPVTEEEKLLLDVITSDSATIAITLRKLLHCDAASCRPAVVSQHGATEDENSGPSVSPLCNSSSKTRPSSVSNKTPQELQPDVLKRGDGRRPQPEPRLRARSEAASAPQFCSKHRRWVRSILQECPDECSEELRLQASAASSPLLYRSSTSTSSSQDLTPSDLVPCPPDRQLTPSQPVVHPPAASEQHHRSPSLLQDISAFSCCQKPSPQTLDTAEQFKQVPASPSSDLRASSPSAREASASQSEDLFSNRDTSSPGSAGQKDSQSTAATPSPSVTHRLPVRPEACGAQLRLSLRSQAALLRSALLQPHVSLTRLSAQECHRLTRSGRAESEEKDPDSSLDVNILYSSHSSSGDCDDSLDSDPDYKPPVERRRRFSEYE